MPVDNPRGMVEIFDDFLGDLIDDAWQVSTDCGGTVTIPTTGKVDGTLDLVTDTTDNDMSELGQELTWRAQDGELGMEVRAKISAITTTAFFIGFNDDELEDSNTLPFELCGTTVTSNAAASIGFLFDTDATTDTIRVVAVDDCNDHACSGYNTGLAPVADTYRTYRIELHDQGSGNMARAHFYICGVLKKTIPAAIDRDVLLSPMVSLENRAGCAARTLSVDYIHVWKSRAA